MALGGCGSSGRSNTATVTVADTPATVTVVEARPVDQPSSAQTATPPTRAKKAAKRALVETASARRPAPKRRSPVPRRIVREVVLAPGQPLALAGSSTCPIAFPASWRLVSVDENRSDIYWHTEAQHPSNSALRAVCDVDMVPTSAESIARRVRAFGPGFRDFREHGFERVALPPGHAWLWSFEQTTRGAHVFTLDAFFDGGVAILLQAPIRQRRSVLVTFASVVASYGSVDALAPEPVTAPIPVADLDPEPIEDVLGFCDTHDCIPNFPNGRGYPVQCADGSWSQSGGIRGACSHHGGVG